MFKYKIDIKLYILNFLWIFNNIIIIKFIKIKIQQNGKIQKNMVIHSQISILLYIHCSAPLVRILKTKTAKLI